MAAEQDRHAREGHLSDLIYSMYIDPVGEDLEQG